jgi:uncharacterized protein
MEGAASASGVWWFLSAAMIVVGVAGTVLPALPGTALVFAGIVLGAWIDGFARVSGWTVGFIAVLAAIAFAVDYLAAVMGAKRAGASRLAMIGAAIGTVAGIFTGLVGLLFMPLAGAVAGEYIAQRRAAANAAGDLVPGGAASATVAGQRAARVGLSTWVGLLLGTVAKLVIVFVMVGIFLAALWI